MQINITSVQLGYSILSELAGGTLPSSESIARYYQSPGIQFLRKHLLQHGGVELSEGVFGKILSNPSSNNVFGKAIINGIACLDMSPRILDFDFQKIEQSLMHRVNLFSAYDISKLNINLYLLYGIRGTSIQLENEIAVDLCDRTLYINNLLSQERLLSMLAHELHHIAVHFSCLNYIETLQATSDKFRCLIIEGLLSEGMAYLYFSSWLIDDPAIKGIWQRNMIDIKNRVTNLEEMLSGIISQQLYTKLENTLFDQDMIGYTIGYYMVKTIQQAFGDERVITLMKTFNLFEEYKAASAILSGN